MDCFMGSQNFKCNGFIFKLLWYIISDLLFLTSYSNTWNEI